MSLAKPNLIKLWQHQLYVEFLDNGSDPAFVYFPGYLSDINAKKAQCLHHFCQTKGLSALFFDYLGHGRSDGNLEDITVTSCFESAKTAITTYLPKRRLILVASSFGAWIACLIAKHWPLAIQGLVFVAPSIDVTQQLLLPQLSKKALAEVQAQGYWADHAFHALVNQQSQQSLPEYRITWRFIEDSLQHLILQHPLSLDCPVRILHGTQDQIIPLSLSQTFCQHLNNNDTKLITHPTNHSFSDAQDLALFESVLTDIYPKALL